MAQPPPITQEGGMGVGQGANYVSHPLSHSHTSPYQGNKMRETYHPSRVLDRPYLMTLYVIFPIHVNFQIRSWCVLKAIIHRKNSVLFYIT